MSDLPEITLLDMNGNSVSLDGFKDQNVIIYFYPRDNTPGCTTEACEFRDFNGEIISMGYKIIGISRDSADSHRKFTEKYGLDFTLLSDPEMEAHKALGAWGTKKMYGKETQGVIRSTFVFTKGKLIKSWTNVKAAGHAARVLEYIRDKVS
ncbi:peroxiredoxin [Myxococcota bacterium]|nr:peroxiredoxin [Myxococcota bacterium]MBU1382097.1 peroxiredoxin [Myxococcota bacterium]MBU1498100.1 peroxiredoxin [Myxococcota bacterium]